MRMKKRLKWETFSNEEQKIKKEFDIIHKKNKKETFVWILGRLFQPFPFNHIFLLNNTRKKTEPSPFPALMSQNNSTTFALSCLKCLETNPLSLIIYLTDPWGFERAAGNPSLGFYIVEFSCNVCIAGCLSLPHGVTGAA